MKRLAEAGIAYVRACDVMGCDCEDEAVCECEYTAVLLVPLFDEEADEGYISGEMRFGSIAGQPWTHRILQTQLARYNTLSCKCQKS